MDLATLKAFKPSEYEEAADGYRATGDMASEAKDAIENRIGVGLRSEVEGDAAGSRYTSNSRSWRATSTMSRPSVVW